MLIHTSNVYRWLLGFMLELIAKTPLMEPVFEIHFHMNPHLYAAQSVKNLCCVFPWFTFSSAVKRLKIK
jgi:hypothetical protein